MLLTWSTVISTIGCLSLALLVYLKAERNKGNIFFSLMTITLGFVVAANFYSLTSKHSETSTLFWIRAVMFFVPFLMLFLYYFAQTYLSDFQFKTRNFLWLLIGSLIVAIVNVTPISYISVSINDLGQIVPKTGPGLALNSLQILPLFTLAIIAMLRNAKQAHNPSDSRKIKYELWLLLFCFGLQVITSFVIVLAFNYTDLVPVGSFLILLFTIWTTISIFRFKYFNIKIFSTFGFSAILAILMLAEVFTASGWQEVMFRIAVFLAVSFVGWQLIKSVRHEIKQKEELEMLTGKLREANMHLKELDKMKDDFLSMASHELNTPLAAIEGYLSMMLDEGMGGKLEPKTHDYLTRIYKASERLSSIVKDLLNVSRIESGRIHLIYAESQVEDILKQAAAEIDPSLKEKKHHICMELPSKPLPRTWIDITRITEVVINFLGNAVKYTDEGGHIEVGAKEEKGNIVIWVKDNGRGIPKDKASQVFEKFTQVDVLKDEVKGTGLGMYISQKFTELHHGKIWFESEGDGKGTTFFCSLPIVKSKPFDPYEGEGEVLR